MNIPALIRDVTAAGLTLAPTERGTLKVNGDDAVIAEWVPTLRTHKAEILAALAAANDATAEAHELISRLCVAWACPPGEFEELQALYQQGKLRLGYIERLICNAPLSLAPGKTSPAAGPRCFTRDAHHSLPDESLDVFHH